MRKSLGNKCFGARGQAGVMEFFFASEGNKEGVKSGKVKRTVEE